MARAIWKGSIAFGLVNVPVKAYTATEDHDIKFHQVHAQDGGRIKYQRVCTVDGKPVDYVDIAKAYESPEGETVILSDEDFARLPAAEKHEIPVLQFVPSEQIDPIFYDKSYYLEPDSKNPKAYLLLAATLERIDRTALVHFTLRQKTRLAALRVREGLLVVQTLLWPDEVRAIEFDSLADAAEPRPQEITMAETLVESMSDDFDPSQYTDEYQVELQKMLDEAVRSGGTVPERAEAVPAGPDAEVVDLVAALQRSLEASGRRASGGGGRAEKKAPAKKSGRAAAKKSSSGKAASKTTARKSTAAKKAPAKKAAQTRKGA